METSMENNGKPIISIKNLDKVFGSGDGSVAALKNVSIDIKKGEIHGIIGMSGAGKSTLIRLMNRLETPTNGTVEFDGQDLMQLSNRELRGVRKRISMIFQHFNLLMQRTVAQNVRYPMEIAETKLSRREQNERVTELLKIVGLESKADAYPSMLSGGQKQRVAIARALATNPDVILSDEATSALDPMTTQSILSLIQEINRTMGITVVIITHEMAVIRQICTCVTIIDGGRIVEEGPVDEVFTHTKSAAGRRLFGMVGDEGPEETEQVNGYRLVFEGASVDKPVISTLARECGLDVNILSANVRQIGGKAYGQMLVQLPADADPEVLKSFIAGQEGITLTEVNEA